MTSTALVAALAGLGFGLSLIVAIGAQGAFVLRQGLRREHVPAIVGICAVSDLIAIALGVGGAGALITAAPDIMGLIKIGGVVFLVFYGSMAFKRAWRGGGTAIDEAPGVGMTLGKAVVTILALTWLNPHFYLDMFVLLGTVANNYSHRWAFAGGAALASVIWFFGLGFGSRLLGPLFSRPRAWQLLDGAIGVVMFAIAFGLATSV